ncbi:transposase [Kitasatospora sp. NPDC088160]|uniref:transposase n=1 Tax=Kitasatospora sp. NPDC088160 TaxID=3364072 RepID=UPI00381D0C68
MSVVEQGVQDEPFAELSRFRGVFYNCLTRRRDALFELTDAVLCTDGPVKTLVGLALAPEHRRGYGALYGALNKGRMDVEQLRAELAGLPLPRAADGRLVLAVDVSPWLRPDADTSDARSFCHTYGRGEARHQMIPGWPYSWVVALESGRTSWVAPLDAVRLEPGADAAAVTAAQLRYLVGRLIAAGQWSPDDPPMLIVADAGYDVMRLAWLLRDLPVEILGRLRSDRVMRRPAPTRAEFALANPAGGRPPKHGSEFIFKDSRTWGAPDAETKAETTRYGTAHAQSWDRLHPELQGRAAWRDHPGQLPVIEGTVVRLQVDHLPSGGDPKPLWLAPGGHCSALKADISGRWHQCGRYHTDEVPADHVAETPDGDEELRWSCQDPDAVPDVGRTIITDEQYDEVRDSADRFLKEHGLALGGDDLRGLVMEILSGVGLLLPPGDPVPDGTCTALHANAAGEWWQCGLPAGHAADRKQRASHDAGEDLWFEGDPDTIPPR